LGDLEGSLSSGREVGRSRRSPGEEAFVVLDGHSVENLDDSLLGSSASPVELVLEDPEHSSFVHREVSRGPVVSLDDGFDLGFGRKSEGAEVELVESVGRVVQDEFGGGRSKGSEDRVGVEVECSSCWVDGEVPVGSHFGDEFADDSGGEVGRDVVLIEGGERSEGRGKRSARERDFDDEKRAHPPAKQR